MIPVILLPEAIDDIDAIARRMAAADLQAGLRFFNAVTESCDLLGRWPMVGTRRLPVDRQLNGLRSYGVIGFRAYLMFFVTRPTSVRVVRVLHGSMDVDQLMGPPA